MNITLRVGSEADFAAVRGVWKAANEARRNAPATEVQHLGKPGSVLLIAQDGEVIAGAALLLPARADDGAGELVPGLCHISMVCVAPEAWGRGIGARLVDRVLGEARARGFGDAQLWTQVDNARACRLYEHRGFVRSGREKEYNGERIVHYTRSLGGAGCSNG